MAEFISLLQAIGTILTAVGAVCSALISLRNGRKLAEIQIQTNGLSTALQATAKKEGHGEGLQQGRDEGRAIASAVAEDRKQ